MWKPHKEVFSNGWPCERLNPFFFACGNGGRLAFLVKFVTLFNSQHRVVGLSRYFKVGDVLLRQ